MRAPRWLLAGVLTLAMIALAGLAALAPAGTATAHNYLVSSSPAPNAVQTEPLDTVTLEFNDLVLNLETNTSFIEVTGPDGATTHFETGCPVTRDRTVVAPVQLGAPGEYRIVWQIVSADGHVVSDTQSFRYEPPSGTPAAAGSPTAPCAAAGSDGDGQTTGAGQSPGAQPGDSSGVAPEASAFAGIGVVIWIAAIVVGLALIGVVLVIIAARRRPQG